MIVVHMIIVWSFLLKRTCIWQISRMSLLNLCLLRGNRWQGLTGKIGESITLDLTSIHDRRILTEIENGMKHDELQERKDDAHRDWDFERRMKKFVNAPDKFQDAPDEAFADMRYSPEVIMFSASRSEILTERVRDIILTVVPENLRDYFFSFYGEGLNNSEIARRDGVSETARRKYQKRLMTIVRDEYIARYGAFEPL